MRFFSIFIFFLIFHPPPARSIPSRIFTQLRCFNQIILKNYEWMGVILRKNSRKNTLFVSKIYYLNIYDKDNVHHRSVARPFSVDGKSLRSTLSYKCQFWFLVYCLFHMHIYDTVLSEISGDVFQQVSFSEWPQQMWIAFVQYLLFSVLTLQRVQVQYATHFLSYPDDKSR